MISFITPTRQPDPANIQRIVSMLPKDSELVVASVPGGAAHARNVGAAAASGDVLVFVDDDVQLETHWDWDRWLQRDWQFAVATIYWPSPEVNDFLMRAESTMLNVLTSVFRYKLFMSGFAAVRRAAFEAVGGYNEKVVFEEHAITLEFYSRRFKGTRLPVRVTVLQRWDSWSPWNDTTSRGKDHPPPKPGEIQILRT